jgi:hypothetical protein
VLMCISFTFFYLWQMTLFLGEFEYGGVLMKYYTDIIKTR